MKQRPLKLKVVNDSTRPPGEVEFMLRWVLDRPQVDLSEGVAVRVLDAGGRSGGHYSGDAADRRRHGARAWAEGARYHVRLTLPLDNWEGYGVHRVCWHSTAAARWNGGKGSLFAHLANRVEQGDTKFGRWPIYVAEDWREVFIHLAAHEVRHLVQFDRGMRISEVDCEEWAAHMLEEWRRYLLTNPDIAGFCYDTTMAQREEEKTMTAAVKDLETALFDAVQKKTKSKVVTKVKKGKQLDTVHVTNESGTKLGLVDRYPNRLRVYVRQNGEYNRLTVATEKDVPRAATALASKAK